MRGNQIACEGYGYRYNVATGTCSAFTPNNKIISSFINETNYNLGTGNRRERDIRDIYFRLNKLSQAVSRIEGKIQ